MIVTSTDARRTPNAKNLDTNGLVTLVSGGKLVKTLESLSACCKDTGTDFTLIYNDGTTDFLIVSAKPIAAHETYMLEDHHIRLGDGQSLKVKAGTANQISVVAITLDAPPVKANNSG